MFVFSNIFISVFVGYLAFTNTFAEKFIFIFHVESREEITLRLDYINTDQNNESELTLLDSEYEFDSLIPDILIKSASYQKAAVIESIISIPRSTSSIEDAIVNIYCTYTTDTFSRTISGTGFFVHPDGVILTNAHVAQFLLLESVNNTGITECIVRSGNPAVEKYEADLLYISPAWISRNSGTISAEKPKGTGERDYALLYATSKLNNGSMPRTFPYLSVDTALMSRSARGNTIVAAGYPAESAIRNGDKIELIPKQAITTIYELFTFGSDYVDIFSIAGSSVGEHGASGGPVVDSDGYVIGLIVTKGDDATDGKRSLRALSLTYIDRTIKEETGFSFLDNLSGNLPFRAKVFADALVPFLSAMLEREL